MKVSSHSSRKTPLSPIVLALDLKGETLSGALVDEKARLLLQRQDSLPGTTSRAAVTAINRMILALAAAPEREAAEIKAVSLTLPGHVDPRTQRITSPLFAQWPRIPLRSLIERGLERSGVDIRVPSPTGHSRAALTATPHPPLIIHPHRFSFVAAEAWAGAARGKRHVVGLLIGPEVAAGILSHGRLIEGVGDLAGAAGWMALGESFGDEYGQRGCLEIEATGAGLVRRALEKWTPNPDSLLGRLTTAELSQLTPAMVLSAARGGDPQATGVVAEVCGWLGRAVADLISLLNPEAVVIGGEFGLALKPFLNDLRREARLWAHPLAAKQCRILNATLPAKSAALLGAARLAWMQVGTERD